MQIWSIRANHCGTNWITKPIAPRSKNIGCGAIFVLYWCREASHPLERLRASRGFLCYTGRRSIAPHWTCYIVQEPYVGLFLVQKITLWQTSEGKTGLQEAILLMRWWNLMLSTSLCYRIYFNMSIDAICFFIVKAIDYKMTTNLEICQQLPSGIIVFFPII